jgi:hypothetical protein
MIDSPLVVPAVTVMERDVTQEDPLCPHDFTCRVCPPPEDETEVLIDCPLNMVVFELLSNE